MEPENTTFRPAIAGAQARKPAQQSAGPCIRWSGDRHIFAHPRSDWADPSDIRDQFFPGAGIDEHYADAQDRDA